MGIKVPSDPWTNEEFFKEWSQLSNRELGRKFGGTEFVWRKWRKRWELADAPRASSQGEKTVEATPEPIVLTTEERIEADRRLIRAKAEAAEFKKLYNAANRDENIYDDIRAEVSSTIARIEPITVLPPHIGSTDTVEDAILGWSDWHGGEVIDFDVMQGYNCYDPTIMCRRAQSTVDTTLSLLFNHHSGTTFENLYVFDLGDGIAGDMLQDNMATNGMGVFQSIVFVAEVRARAIAELAQHIPVIYVSVPGNHGRRSMKMPWKQPSETADWLIANIIKERCANLDNVTVVVPSAWTSVVNIRGWNHSLNHGYASAKGGYGGIPFYAFQRADGKKTALESAHNNKVDYRWMGHIHTPAELPKMDGVGSQFVVGTLAGGNEYALEELNAYGDPMQLLVGCNEKHGVTWRYPLQVKFADEVESRYEDAIPRRM